MPDRPHHTAKMKSCVEKVMADGHDESSAYAICTESMKKAGEPIFEAAEMILESVHLRGAAGAVRVEPFDGKDHLVLPCVALIGDQIIHAVNAEHPERVTTETLVKAAESFNSKPVVLGHPTRNGKQISANDPAVLETHGIGTIRNSRMAGSRLLMDVYVDPARAEKIGGAKLVEDLRASLPCDVSVGAFVSCDETPGELNGKKYKATWLETLGDHLAILWPKGRGACSWESGCGIRAAMNFITAEGINLEETEPDSLALLVEKFTTLAGARHSADDRQLIQVVHDHATALGATCSGQYKIAESHTVGDTNAAAKAPQTLRAACGCQGEKKMAETNTKKAELIAALVTDKHSGFHEGDEAKLETFEEARLEEFKTAAAARATAEEARTKSENEQRNLAARLKVADEKLKGTEEKLKAAEQKPTKEQWLEMAPPEIRALLDQEEKRNTEHRTELVTQLKAAQSEFNEEDLGAMEISMLERLVRTVKVPEPDYSGRAIPAPRAAAAKDEENYAPPNPYERDIKTLQARQH